MVFNGFRSGLYAENRKSFKGLGPCDEHRFRSTRFFEIFDYLTLPRDGAIGYEDFLKLSSAARQLLQGVSEAFEWISRSKWLELA